MKGLLFLGCW